jgi:zinc-ribbon domain
VKCASCGCENREGAKFCGECAAPLAGVRYDVRQKPPRIGLKKAQRFLDPPDVA